MLKIFSQERKLWKRDILQREKNKQKTNQPAIKQQKNAQEKS